MRPGTLRLAVLALAAVTIAYQTGVIFASYSKVWVATVWKHRGLTSYDRSARFMLKPEGADYIRFLDSVVAPRAPIVLPEGTGRFSEQSTLQFFLMPRPIPGCGCDPSLFPQAGAACIACLQHPAHAVPALRDFPPAEVDLAGKLFIPYESADGRFRGVYLPSQAPENEGVRVQAPAPPRWRAAVIDAVLLVGLVVLGALVCASFRRRVGLAETVSLGFPIGLALTTWLVFVLSWVGMRVDLALYLGAWGVWVAASLMILQLVQHVGLAEVLRSSLMDVRRAIAGMTWVRSLLLGAAAFLLAQMIVISVGRGYSLFDAIANWGLKGYAIAQEGTILAGESWGGHALAYPQNLHLGIALFRVADGDVLPGSKLLDPVLLIALLAGCFRFWRRRGVDAELGLAGSVVLLSVPVIFFHGTIGYANLAYTTYLLLGCLWILEGSAEERSSALALGSILLAGAAWTRPEGALTASALGASLVVAGALAAGKRPRLIAAILPFAVMVGVWMAFALPHIRADGSGTLISTALLELAPARQGLGPLVQVVDYAKDVLFIASRWGLLYSILPLLALVAVIRARPRDWRHAAPVAVLLLLGTAIPLAIMTAAGYSWTDYLDDAFDRAWLPAAVTAFVCLWQWAGGHVGAKEGNPSVEAAGATSEGNGQEAQAVRSLAAR